MGQPGFLLGDGVRQCENLAGQTPGQLGDGGLRGRCHAGACRRDHFRGAGSGDRGNGSDFLGASRGQLRRGGVAAEEAEHPLRDAMATVLL